ncbi:MAG: ferrous iron transport protein A [Bifidobacteriaceae bacterium]|jgi:Fe2+ transport system protein FeoA|nr:ferrous iron transport protein A [Bifidobacteriaceae bacterium]
MSAAATRALSDVPVRSTVEVVAVKGGDAARRLMEMGVTPGCELTVVRVAPLGDPVEVRLRGYRLTLRKSEAAHIEVTAADGAPA